MLLQSLPTNAGLLVVQVAAQQASWFYGNSQNNRTVRRFSYNIKALSFALKLAKSLDAEILLLRSAYPAYNTIKRRNIQHL